MTNVFRGILSGSKEQAYTSVKNVDEEQYEKEHRLDGTREGIRMIDASNAIATIPETSYEDSILYSNYQRRSKTEIAKRFTRIAAFHLAPSWISRHWDKSEKKPVKTFPTDYLNGVRGVAACTVIGQHYLTLYYHHWPFDGYGSKKTNYHVAQMPYIRLWYAGKYAVAIFYILSGYVLAYKPIQYVRQGNTEALANNLISGIFRRFLRLFLPVLPPILIVGFLVASGFMPKDSDPFAKGNAGTGHWWYDFWRYVANYDHAITPWSLDDYHPQFLEALYTLRYEFRGSIMVFTLVMGLAKTKSWIRMVVLWLVSLYALKHGRWDSFLFTQGIVLAELRYIRAARAAEGQTRSLSGSMSTSRSWWVGKRLLCLTLLLLSLHLGSWPRRRASKTWGLSFFDRYTPSPYHTSDEHKNDFWTAIAALCLLYSIENFPALQKPFETRFARYLGDISFSIYIWHFPVLYATSRAVALPLMRWLGKDLGFLVNFLLVLPGMVWISDVQWRLVDMQSVKLARVLEGWVAAT